MVDFSKKSLVIITGASKGIGQTIATELATHLNENSLFVLLARDLSGLEETKLKILSIKPSLSVLTFGIDLANPDLNSYKELLSKALDASTGLDVAFLFHNAGHVGVLKPASKLTDLQTWRQYYDLNLFSAVLLNSAFIDLVKPIIHELVVVNITSLVGRVPFVNMSMYGSGKAARESFFKVLAIEEPEITVLNYSPGPVLTDMFHSICDTASDENVREQFQEVRKTTVLTPAETVGKLLNVLKKGDYKSGDTIDYFDRI